SYGSFESVGRATRYYREQCAHYGWTPTPEQIIYRANMLLAETDDEAEAQFRQLPNQRPFSMRPGVTDALNKLDSRNVAGQARAPIVGGALPTTFVGGPDPVVENVRGCRDEVCAGVLGLLPHPPGSSDLDPLMRALDLFGAKVLPRIRDICGARRERCRRGLPRTLPRGRRLSRAIHGSRAGGPARSPARRRRAP